MIRGVHTMFYTSEAQAMREFIRDKLGFSGSDVGEGWLIFDRPEAEMGCHPADAEDGKTSGTHDISFYCDDIEATVAELFRWLSRKDWEQWDGEIEADSQAGRLDFLVREAREEKAKGTLKGL